MPIPYESLHPSLPPCRHCGENRFALWHYGAHDPESPAPHSFESIDYAVMRHFHRERKVA